jgi:hypothetical protein
MICFISDGNRYTEMAGKQNIDATRNKTRSEVVTIQYKSVHTDKWQIRR